MGGSNAHIIVSDEGIPEACIASLHPKIPLPNFNKKRYWPEKDVDENSEQVHALDQEDVENSEKLFKDESIFEFMEGVS